VAPLIDDRLALTGDVGGRAVFAKHPIAYVPWQDAAVLLDVDTWEDYQRLPGLEARSG
jgi:CTP:molybdopterin cytidylyltransferase MocA